MRRHTFFSLKERYCLRVLTLTLLAFAWSWTATVYGQSKDYLSHWPSTANPDSIGRALTRHFIQSPHTNFGQPGLPGSLTYPESCAWYGALVFSAAVGDSAAVRELEMRYEKLVQSEKRLLPKPDFVDNNVFGIVPLELYLLTGKKGYLQTGQMYADKEWILPKNANSRQQVMADRGYSWLSRLWIDDMYMITAVQSLAYRATLDTAYSGRAAREVLFYLKELQEPDGLFFHAANAPFYWGRGNGWVAAGMTELLQSLPVKSPERPYILGAFRKMMTRLKKYQSPGGMWRQLLDDPGSWEESSGTAMFTYAMITGVKNGWLEANKFGPVARKGWLGLVAHLNADAELTGISEGTNKNASRQFYLDRKRETGDLHGQAPMLWCAAALMGVSPVLD